MTEKKKGTLRIGLFLHAVTNVSTRLTMGTKNGKVPGLSAQERTDRGGFKQKP